MAGKQDRNRKSRDNPIKGREIAISKALSYILRHAAEREGLKMDAQGYANVSDVVCFANNSWAYVKREILITRI